MDEIHPGTLARKVMRAVDRATLATLADGGAPYASLVLTALDHDGTPILLISRLARHTRNIENDARVSLLFDGTANHADPLTGPRVTVMGRLQPSAEPRHRARYLARHPAAAAYAGFSDFAIHAMAVDHAHLVAGFGRIHQIDGAALLAPHSAAEAMATAEQRLLATVNARDGALASQLATRLQRADGSAWRVSGIDCDGVDLQGSGTWARLHFPQVTAAPDDAEALLHDPQALEAA